MIQVIDLTSVLNKNQTCATVSHLMNIFFISRILSRWSEKKNQMDKNNSISTTNVRSLWQKMTLLIITHSGKKWPQIFLTSNSMRSSSHSSWAAVGTSPGPKIHTWYTISHRIYEISKKKYNRVCLTGNCSSKRLNTSRPVVVRRFGSRQAPNLCGSREASGEKGGKSPFWVSIDSSMLE